MTLRELAEAATLPTPDIDRPFADRLAVADASRAFYAAANPARLIAILDAGDELIQCLFFAIDLEGRNERPEEIAAVIAWREATR